LQSTPLFAAYVTLTFGLVITPGATTAVVVRNALAGGRRGGLLAATGAAIGNSTHATAAGLGVAILVSRAPVLLTVIRVAGGLYLAWLGARSLWRVVRRQSVPIASTIIGASDDRLDHHAVREGITVNLLNPAIITFYLAVVPTFVPDEASPLYYLLLAATHVGMAFVVHSAWAVGFDGLRHVLERPRARVVLEAATGAALVVLALRVLG
jgi:threonine/homoserine/homoserine lactone efflux protein